MLAAIAYKIYVYLVETNKFQNEYISRLMLVEAAAYICNIGNDKSENDGSKCREKHRADWDKWYTWYVSLKRICNVL
uniref:Uncharacterized protein n=1 Tax=Meloidogyne incognita TaxID=6306 RepID=A0A914NEZ2_MELIC